MNYQVKRYENASLPSFLVFNDFEPFQSLPYYLLTLGKVVRQKYVAIENPFDF
jgi:hypothetical protein